MLSKMRHSRTNERKDPFRLQRIGQKRCALPEWCDECSIGVASPGVSEGSRDEEYWWHQPVVLGIPVLGERIDGFTGGIPE